MTKEGENALAIRSLAELDANPVLQIETARLFNSEVHKIFEVARFLQEINEKIFKGKGEVKPLKQGCSVYPQSNEQDKEQSRFTRLFSVGYEVSSVLGESQLYIKKEDFEGENEIKGNEKFRGLNVTVSQWVDVARKRVGISVRGSLHFGSQSNKRTHDGNWDGVPIFMTEMGHSRFVTFSLDDIPAGETIRQEMFRNALEVLRELGVHGFIPSIKVEPQDENPEAPAESDIPPADDEPHPLLEGKSESEPEELAGEDAQVVLETPAPAQEQPPQPPKKSFWKRMWNDGLLKPE